MDLYKEMWERAEVPAARNHPCKCTGGACEEPGLAPYEFCAAKRCQQFLKDFGISPEQWRAEVVRQARAEIAMEEQRVQIEAEKARIRARSNRTLWQKLFPWKLVRRD